MSDPSQSERMIKLSSLEETIKDTREKSFKYLERNGSSILTSLPRIKPTELHIKFQSMHQRLQLLNLKKEKTEWPESLKLLPVLLPERVKLRRKSELPIDVIHYLNFDLFYSSFKKIYAFIKKINEINKLGRNKNEKKCQNVRKGGL